MCIYIVVIVFFVVVAGLKKVFLVATEGFTIEAKTKCIYICVFLKRAGRGVLLPKSPKKYDKIYKHYCC